MRKFFDGEQVYECLKIKGINSLYHANTVATSMTYISQGALLSREYAESNDCIQTAQSSDTLDKHFDIYNDIFLDGMDIHSQFNRANHYGPFMFVFDSQILKSQYVTGISITKINPVHWKRGGDSKNWYYDDLDDFSLQYGTGKKWKDVGSMFMLRTLGGQVPFTPYLREVVLDDPEIVINYRDSRRLIKDVVTEQFEKMMKGPNYEDVQKSYRHRYHTKWCSCTIKYNKLSIFNFEELKRLFHHQGNHIEKGHTT